MPVAPLLVSDPLLGVVAVCALVDDRVINPFRVPPASAVLDGTGIPLIRQAASRLDKLIQVVGLRSAQQHCREGTGPARHVDVGGELNAVPHRHLHVDEHAPVTLGVHSVHLRCRRTVANGQGASTIVPVLTTVQLEFHVGRHMIHSDLFVRSTDRLKRARSPGAKDRLARGICHSALQ